MKPVHCALALAAAFLLASCGIGGAGERSREEEEGRVSGDDLLRRNDPGTETDPEKRVNDMLQQAKAAYDDGTYQAAHRYAEQAERLVREKKVKDKGYVATAINIQAYSLLQLGLVDDYRPEGMPGYVRGALTKFEDALRVSPDSFRAQLGLALCKFRRHGVNVSKSEKLGEGVLCLAQIEATLHRAFEAKEEATRRAEFKRASDLYAVLISGRDKLLAIYEIFHDPSSMPLDPNTRTRPEAPRLPRREVDSRGRPVEFGEERETLVIKDLQWVIETARDGGNLRAEAPQLARESAALVRTYWSDVRFYWRKKALKDLQEARDAFLELERRDREQKRGTDQMRYFWIDRDLGFVFLSMGAFFLDMAFEEARQQSLAMGRPVNEVERHARSIIIDSRVKTEYKTEARRNYESALSYFSRFVQQHEQFERLMLNKAEKADYNDVTENPFLVDLQARYRSEMLESVREERGMRRAIILEQCSLVVDPLYQNPDLEKALLFAAQLKALNPRDPIHHFVRATAYFERGAAYQAGNDPESANSDFVNARDEYQAYMRASSVVEDAAQRRRARDRVEECEKFIKAFEISKAAGGK